MIDEYGAEQQDDFVSRGQGADPTPAPVELPQPTEAEADKELPAIRSPVSTMAASRARSEIKAGVFQTPTVDPDFGLPTFLADSFMSAWSYNLTKSALDYTSYYLKGKVGTPINEATFDYLLKEDGMEGMLKWKEGMTEEQYTLMADFTRDNHNRMERMRVSSEGRTGRGLAASLAGGVLDPAMIPLMMVPALNIEYWAIRSSMASTMGLTKSQVAAFSLNAPKTFRQMAKNKGLTSSGSSLTQSMKRGFVYGSTEAAILEPAIYAFNTAVQKDYTLMDSAVSVGLSGFLGGAIIHPGINIYSRARTGGRWQAAVEGKVDVPDSVVNNAEMTQFEDNFSAFYEIAAKKGMTAEVAADTYINIGLGRKNNRDQYIGIFENLKIEQKEKILSVISDLLSKTVDDPKIKEHIDVPDDMTMSDLVALYRASRPEEKPGKYDLNEKKPPRKDKLTARESEIVAQIQKSPEEVQNLLDMDARFKDSETSPMESAWAARTMLSRKDRAGRLNQSSTFKELYDASRPARRTDPKVRLTEESIISDLYESTFGVEVRFIEPGQAAELNAAGRVYSRHGDVLFVMAGDKATMSFIAGHEMFHGIKAQNAKLFLGIIDAINSWQDGAVVLKGMEDRVAMLTDHQFARIPFSKHLEETYANIFGEVVSDPRFWKHLESRVPENMMGQFRRSLKELIERLIDMLGNIASRYGIDIETVPIVGASSKKRLGITKGIKDSRFQSMIKEIADLMQVYDATSIDPYHAKVGSKRYDELIQSRIKSRAEALRKTKSKYWENQTKQFRARMEDEANVVFWNTQDEAPASLLRQDPLFDWAQTPPKKKEDTRNIRAYATSIPSVRNPEYAKTLAHYLQELARESSIQAHLGPLIGDLRKQQKGIRTRLLKAEEAKDKEAYARLLKRSRELNKTERATSRDFAKSKQRLKHLSDDLMNMGQIIIEDTGTHYIVHYNRNVRDTVVRRPGDIMDVRGRDDVATGDRLQFDEIDSAERTQRRADENARREIQDWSSVLTELKDLDNMNLEVLARKVSPKLMEVLESTGDKTKAVKSIRAMASREIRANTKDIEARAREPKSNKIDSSDTVSEDVELHYGSTKEGQQARWFDPSEPERVLTWDEVAEANDWVTKDSDSMMLRDDVDDWDTQLSPAADLDKVRAARGQPKTPKVEPTLDWWDYRQNNFYNSGEFDPGFSEVDFEALADFLPSDPRSSQYRPSKAEPVIREEVGPDGTASRTVESGSFARQPEDLDMVIQRDFAQWKERMRQQDIARRIEEESDDLSLEFLNSLKRKVKDGTISETILGKDKESWRNQMWDLLRVSYRGNQNYDPKVITRIKKQAEAYDAKSAAEKAGPTRGFYVGEAMEDGSFSPQLMDIVYKILSHDWKKGIYRAEADDLKGLSVKERSFFVNIQRMYDSEFYRARLISRAMLSSRGDLSRKSITQRLLNDTKGGPRVTENDADALYDRMVEIISAMEDPAITPRSPQLGLRAKADKVSAALQELSYRDILREVRTEQVRSMWVDDALGFSDRALGVKHMLSKMDGQYRDGLDPEQVVVSVTNKMRSRQYEDLNPLLQVMARMAGMWDELTSPHSPTMQKVFLYIKNQDPENFSGMAKEKADLLIELAETLTAVNRVQMGVLRDLGSNGTHRPDYTISMKHDKYRIGKVEKSVWIDRLMEDLDWDKTFKRMGIVGDPRDAKINYLEQVYADIMNNRYREFDDPSDDYMAVLHKETSYSRTMIFKPEAEWQYDIDFGSGSPTHSLLEQIRRRSDLAVLMEEFGPNPKETWKRIKNDLNLNESNISVSQLNGLLDYHTGVLDNPANRKMAAMGQMAQNLANSVVLGNAGITAMTDMVHSIDLLNYYGVPLGTFSHRYWQSVHRAWKRNKKGSPFQLAMRVQGAGADPTLSATSRRLGGDLPFSESSRILADLTFSANGLNLQTAISQEALVDTLNRNLAMLIDTGDFAPTLRRYGLTDAEIKTIRESEASVVDIDGPVMKIIPDNVAEKDPIAARKLRHFLDDSMRQAALEPTATGQLFARMGTRSGTIMGTLVRQNTMYMAFGMSVFQKTYRRMLYGYKDQGFIEIFKNPMNRRALNAMSFAAWSMALGYVTMNMKEILRGREPVHLGNMNEMHIRKWLWQSGAAGILSDLFWLQDATDVGKFFVGPPISMAMNQAKPVFDLDFKEFMIAGERNLPGATLPIAGELRRNIFGFVVGEAVGDAVRMQHSLLDPSLFSPNNSGKGPLDP